MVFREHLAFLLCKDTETFALVLRAIHDALEQPPLAALAASALDHLATFAFTKRTRLRDPGRQREECHCEFC